MFYILGKLRKNETGKAVGVKSQIYPSIQRDKESVKIFFPGIQHMVSSPSDFPDRGTTRAQRGFVLRDGQVSSRPDDQKFCHSPP